jgi:hypothetical protein
MKHRRKIKGLLPHPEWLAQNGYHGLVTAMRQHPEAFAHIEQSHKRKPLTEHVQDAKRLAHDHGRLPYPKWLLRNGYSSLHYAMFEHPDAFAGIKQASKKGKCLADHLEDAKRLVCEHGRLPNPWWLETNGYRCLARAMCRHPEAFARIKQLRKTKSLAEHLQDAKRLVRRHRQLPNPLWLVKNGYNNLYNMMRKYPTAFADIKQASKKGKSLAEHVQDAKRLARKHGQLPNPQWLIEHGYCGLNVATHRHPENFDHVPQKRLR